MYTLRLPVPNSLFHRTIYLHTIVPRICFSVGGHLLSMTVYTTAEIVIGECQSLKFEVFVDLFLVYQ